MPCSSAPDWVVDAFGVTVLIAAFMLMNVMQKTEQSSTHAKDAKWIKDTRRAMYIVVAFAAANSFFQSISPLSVLILVWAAIGLLVITAIGLDQRHPQNGHRFVSFSLHPFSRWTPLRQVIAFFRRRA